MAARIELKSVTTELQKAPHGVVTFFILTFGFIGLFSPNPIESAWWATIFIVTLRLWFWKQFPGIFLWLFLIQFIESHTSVIEANSFNLTLNELYPGTGRKTWWLSSIGLLFTMFGATYALKQNGKILLPSIDFLREQAKQISQLRLFSLFFLSKAFTLIIKMLIPYGSSLMQFETYVPGITTALTFAIGVQFTITRQRPVLVFFLFLYLLAEGFYSYFSSWRDPFILAGVCYLTTIKQIGLQELRRIAPILAPVIALIFIWQSVKGEYRNFISGGLEDQGIRVSQTEALIKFAELANTSLSEGNTLSEEVIEATYTRAGYIEYFSAAVGKVPKTIPHQRGELLLESLGFSLVPRILNPNKGLKNDREKVERFTDYYFGGERNISSFSLGHYCEAYIDWGPIGMMFQLFIFGAVGGILFRITNRRAIKLNPILSLGIVWTVLLPWGTFQHDMVTLSGKVVWGTFCHLVLFFPLYKWSNQFVQIKAVDDYALQQP